MPIKLSHLHPNYILQEIDKKYPKFKAFHENPKVQRVAGHAFKAIACIGFGAALGLVVVTPLGTSLLVGIGVGAGIGVLSYFSVAGVLFILKKYGFPADRFKVSPPLSKDQWFSDKNYKKFKTVYTGLTHLDCLQEWKKTHHIQSDDKAQKKLWKECQKGFCQSEAQNLIALLKEDPDLSGQGLLNKIEAEDLFHRQILEIIRADLVDNQEIEDLCLQIPNAKEILHKSFSKDELKNDPLLLNSLKNELKRSKKYQAIAATIRLQNDNESHTIFVQLYPKFRFYDPYNPVFTGFHEGFKSKGQCLRMLQRHIQGYQTKTRPTALKFDDIIIRGYRIDCPDLKKKQQTAQAGGIPLQK